jgi:hypothetical protein
MEHNTEAEITPKKYNQLIRDREAKVVQECKDSHFNRGCWKKK